MFILKFDALRCQLEDLGGSSSCLVVNFSVEETVKVVSSLVGPLLSLWGCLSYRVTCLVRPSVLPGVVGVIHVAIWASWLRDSWDEPDLPVSLFFSACVPSCPLGLLSSKHYPVLQRVHVSCKEQIRRGWLTSSVREGSCQVSIICRQTWSQFPVNSHILLCLSLPKWHSGSHPYSLSSKGMLKCFFCSCLFLCSCWVINLVLFYCHFSGNLLRKSHRYMWPICQVELEVWLNSFMP